MNNTLEKLVTHIHESEHQAVLAITGGGSGAISQLLRIPGGSRTILEAVVPYASTALADWLGTAAEQSCSEATARAMAMASWMRARTLAPESDPHKLIGIGATASLASDRPKRGEHRVHIAAETAAKTVTCSLILAKGKRERAHEEDVASDLVLIALADASSSIKQNEIATFIEHSLLPGEKVQWNHHQAQSEWTGLLLGERNYVCLPDSFQPKAIFSGAFNPPHTGHREMVRVASMKLGGPIAYELSITNVDKPPLDFIEIDRRLGVLRSETASVKVVLTDAPTFRKKSELFPGCTFVVGVDTIARVGDPRYYTGAEGSFDAAIQQIADRGCRFLVFGREIDGAFCVLSDLALPAALRKLCDEVTGEEFREDVSSTELRDK